MQLTEKEGLDCLSEMFALVDFGLFVALEMASDSEWYRLNPNRMTKEIHTLIRTLSVVHVLYPCTHL